MHDGVVSGAAVHDHVTGRDAEIHADLTVNATGPWSERVASLAGVDVPIRPSPGVMLALRGRLCNMVINRLHRVRRRRHRGAAAGAVDRRDQLMGGRGSGRSRRPRGPRRADGDEEGSKLIPAVATATHPRRLVGGSTLDRLAGRGRLGPRAVPNVQDDRPRGRGTAPRDSSRSPEARAPRCAGWRRCVPTSSAASSAWTSRVARGRPCCSPTSPTSPRDGRARARSRRRGPESP